MEGKGKNDTRRSIHPFVLFFATKVYTKEGSRGTPVGTAYAGGRTKIAISALAVGPW